MNSKNRSLTKIISALCACATVAGGVSSAADNKVNTNTKTGTNSTVDFANRKSRVGNIVDYMKKNPGKSVAIGATGLITAGGIGYGIKKLYDKHKSGKEKPVASVKETDATASKTQVSDAQVNNDQASNTNTNQVSTPQHPMKSAGDIRINVGSDVKDKGKIWMRRSFGQSHESRFKSRDGYIAAKLYGMGFKDAGLNLNEHNCTVFDLNNKNYSLYVFDFSAEIPSGAKEFVQRIGNTNICYALGKGDRFKGSSLVKSADYNLTIKESSDQSFDYSMYIDADKL